MVENGMSYSLYTNPIISKADPNQAAFWYKRIVPEMGKKMSWIRSKERVRGIVASHSSQKKNELGQIKGESAWHSC